MKKIPSSHPFLFILYFFNSEIKIPTNIKN